MKYVLSVLFILSSLVVYAQGGNITISQWEGLHAEQKQVAKKTLDMFPSTWQEFIELYGWDDTKMAGKPFYNRQLNDAEYLYNNRQLINYDLFTQKVVKPRVLSRYQRPQSLLMFTSTCWLVSSVAAL